MNEAIVNLLMVCAVAEQGAVTKLLEVGGGTSEQVTTDTAIFFRKATFWGLKAFTAEGVKTNNAGAVLLGTLIGGQKRLVWSIAAGTGLEVEAVNGAKLRLSDFWANGTATDGVVVIYH